ncbi:MAG TPA: 2-oxoglutarate dehydrogenase, E2 component, dihydrolipoamide succinyltransferase [Thermoanaerobaculia bacterium]|nr:2-oxoglutarate dehydrogenase, E2 component, dihydrolipoamide succinyltransferase [Thermoanaerobaculia bacterium]
MATEVVMPQMGESIAEGTITKWLVKPGDKVERDQPLFEISTDKVDAEIPSPVAGTLLEIKAEEGQTVPVNEIVALVGEEGEGAGAEATEKAEPTPQPTTETEEAPADEERDRPAQPQAESTAQRAETARGDAEPAPETRGAAESDEATGEGGEGGEEERLRKFSSPLVRKIAREEGVDLAEVEGTGVHGRITKQDILGHIEQRGKQPAEKPAARQPAAQAPAAASPAPSPQPRAAAAAAPAGGDFHVAAYSEGDDVEIEPMSKIRQITAAHMVYSKRTSAHVTTVFHVDFSRVAHVRARHKRRFQEVNGTKLTFMPFIFKALATGLKQHKQLNASIDGTNIVYKKDINIGMAVDIEGRGLLVPVIRNADQLSLVGLAKAANDLADRARAKKLGPDELKGGTFTVTNPGVFGSLFGTPVINQPQVAILGVGAIEKRPVVVTDELGVDSLAIKTMCYLSITYDHRLVDGADADRFMIDVKKVIEEDTWAELG